MCDCSIDALVMQRVPISHAAFALGRARGAYPESIEFLRRSASPCIRSFFAASCLAERVTPFPKKGEGRPILAQTIAVSSD